MNTGDVGRVTTESGALLQRGATATATATTTATGIAAAAPHHHSAVIGAAGKATAAGMPIQTVHRALMAF